MRKPLVLSLCSTLLLVVAAGCGSKDNASPVPSVVASPNSTASATASPSAAVSIAPSAIPALPTANPSAGVATTAPSALPSSDATATPSATPIATSTVSVATAAPVASPTSAASTSPANGTIPIFTPLNNPTTNTHTGVSFDTGTGASVSFGSFEGGTVTVVWPITGQIPSSGYLTATGYNGFPTWLPTISGATNVIALLKQDVSGTSIPFLNGDISYTWNTHAGTPTGQWHIAYYSPATDVNSGWHTGVGSSAINGNQVVISIPQPTGVGILANSSTYFAIYQ